MQLPADWSTWVHDLRDVRICSDEVVDGSREITVEATRGGARIVRTFEVDPESELLNGIRETSDEVPTQPEGDETDGYVEAVAYFDRLFRNPRALGELDLPSGCIAVISPDQLEGALHFPIEGLERRVSPGKYRLEALRSDNLTVGYRVLFSHRPAVTYRDATRERVGSDVATMLWLDIAGVEHAMDAPIEFGNAGTGIRVLEDGTTVGVTRTSADGGYPLLWGIDADGVPACLVLDLWFEAPRETLDRTIVVKDRLPPDVLEVGLRAERAGDEIVLLAPDTIRLFPADPRPRSESRNCATGLTRMGFKRGERVRVSWRGRKLV